MSVATLHSKVSREPACTPSRRSWFVLSRLALLPAKAPLLSSIQYSIRTRNCSTTLNRNHSWMWDGRPPGCQRTGSSHWASNAKLIENARVVLELAIGIAKTRLDGMRKARLSIENMKQDLANNSVEPVACGNRHGIVLFYRCRANLPYLKTY